PDVVRAQRTQPLRRFGTDTTTLPRPLPRPFQALVTPEALHPLAVHAPSLPTHDPRGHLVTPTRMRLRDRTQLRAQLTVLDRARHTRLALRRPMLTRHPTREPFGNPETFLQAAHRPPASLRGQKFPSANSLSIAFSGSA